MGALFGRCLAGAGARVVLAALRGERLEEVAAGIRAEGGEALALRCDVAREEEVDRLVAQTLGAFGRADILVNNAGFTTVVPAEE
jgi:NAD(P)-dependent dehydrogenase (short-subunit alcohol dehydrogenase family)